MTYTFYVPFAALLFAIVFCDKKYAMLRDSTKAAIHKPYSWSRVQMAWWTLIILSSFIAILWHNGVAPELDQSSLILLGISVATTATARMIDISDETSVGTIRHQDSFGKNFFLDILSDSAGVSIHRFQTLVFNVAFGIWFIAEVNMGLQNCNTQACANTIIPIVSPNNLILLGLSSATYAALKSAENKTATVESMNADDAETIPDEAVTTTIAQG